MIYVGGSLRNPRVLEVAGALRAAGHEVYDEWMSPGSKADEEWQEYEKQRGRGYREALGGWHAEMVFENDLWHLRRADTFVLVLPAGRSAHLELGWMSGKSKRTAVLLLEEPDRYDIMYRFADYVAESVEELIEWLNSSPSSS